MASLPLGVAVADHVFTNHVVDAPTLTHRSVVHQICNTTTVCGLPGDTVPHRIAAGYAALIGASWCPLCFPADRAA